MANTKTTTGTPDDDQALRDRLEAMFGSSRNERERIKRKYNPSRFHDEGQGGNKSNRLKFNASALIPWLTHAAILAGAIALGIYTSGVYIEIGYWISQGQGLIELHALGARQVLDWPLIGWPLAALLFSLVWILQGTALTFLGAISALVYATLQILEIRPILIRFSPQFMRAKIEQVEEHEKVEIKESDSYGLALIKHEYNNYYLEDLESAERMSFWAYVIDGSVMMLLMPLVMGSNGDEIRLVEALSKLEFMTTDLMWSNIIRLVCSLYLIGVTVKFALILKKNAPLFTRK